MQQGHASEEEPGRFAADELSAERWRTAMLRGDFAAAWLESDAIRGRGGEDAYRFWNGERLEGARVIVRCLHGFGDAVQMLRYAPKLRQLAASVVYEVPPRMVELAPFFEGVEQVVSWGEDAPGVPPAWDVQMEIMELPYLFRTTLGDLPMTERYLELPAAFVARAAQAMGVERRPRIGVVWAGGAWNPGRSIPLRPLEPLLRDERFAFWNPA